jgi:hypothetical protein
MRCIRKSIPLVFLILIACTSVTTTENKNSNNFSSDVEFLKKYSAVLVLKSEDDQTQIAVLPSLQGRVMTSTANGNNGFSFGWINKEAFSKGDTSVHMNAFGGEDRFWLGPEGGQYSIYFEKGKKFEFENWHVPRLIDLDPFDLILSDKSSAAFEKQGQLANYSGTVFDFSIFRKIQLLEKSEIAKTINVRLSDSVKMVGYQSVNSLKNIGKDAWQKETGLLSIWILGMFNPSPGVTVFIPVNSNTPSDSIKVNDRYFGAVPKERLIIRDNIIYFKADGTLRSKIGLSPQLATPFAGSYDAENKILTIVHFNKPDHITDYVNSFWEIQKAPYSGDVINAYNDGPPSPGAKPMGPFYELETSSPAAALQPEDSIVHVHTTMHFQGDEKQLSEIAKRVFGIEIDQITSAFNRR